MTQFETELEFEAPVALKAARGELSIDEVEMVRYKTAFSFDLQSHSVPGTQSGSLWCHNWSCSTEVKEALKSDTVDIAIKNDVTGLLGKLKQLSHDSAAAQDPYWSAQLVLRRLLNCQQHSKETVHNYTMRFMSLAQVVAAQWGPFNPSKIANSTSTNDNAKMQRETNRHDLPALCRPHAISTT